MLRSPAEEPSRPWYAVLLGFPALSISSWCADQTIVQRVLGAKDENHARTGPLFCGLIKILAGHAVRPAWNATRHAVQLGSGTERV